MNGKAVVVHLKHVISTWKSIESINCLISASNRTLSGASKKEEYNLSSRDITQLMIFLLSIISNCFAFANNVFQISRY